jgi:D-arabinose 1-dehydrogenase-like Zn-dependent alcohol dehydrogenase
MYLTPHQGKAAPKVGVRVVVRPFYFCGCCRRCFLGEESMCDAADICGVMNQGGCTERVAERAVIGKALLVP